VHIEVAVSHRFVVIFIGRSRACRSGGWGRQTELLADVGYLGAPQCRRRRCMSRVVPGCRGPALPHLGARVRVLGRLLHVPSGTLSSDACLSGVAPMLGLMKRDLVVASKAVGGAGLTGAVLYLVATVPTHVHVYWPYWLFLAAILVGVGLYFAGQERNPATDQDDAPPPPTDQQAGPAITDWWRVAIDDVSSGLLQLQSNAVSHPGYTSRLPQVSPPPSVRIGLMVGCSPLDPVAPLTSEIRAKFLSFLGQSQLMHLVRALTDVRESAVWRAWDDSPRFNFGAILCPPDSEEAPVAWARLLIPEASTRRYGRDARCAYLVLYVEPRTGAGTPAPAAGLVAWYHRFSESLRVPAALVNFLRQQLGLRTSNDPVAEVGIWLNAPRALTEMIDTDGFKPVPGSLQSNCFTGFAMADPDGQPVVGMAEAWLRQMCDSSLHLDDREAVLSNLETESAGGRRLVVEVSTPVWASWRQLAFIVALHVKLTNTTDGTIRLGSIDWFGGFWGPDPPDDLPVIDGSERHDLQQEIEARRKDRFSPGLSDRTTILPHESISGWIVTGVPLSSSGGTPTLQLTVHEAVGYQYRTVIHPAEPQAHRPTPNASAADRPDATVKNSWQSRDLPVLAAVVRLLDEAHYPHVRVSEIAEASGRSIDEVAAAVKALDGTYLTLKTTLGEPGSWFVTRLTSAARQAVGQWPH
jgi:hypothetical protein